MTSQGRVTLPKGIRDTLHLRPGDRVEFIVRGENEALMRRATRTAAEVFGRLRKPGRSSKTVAQMNEAVARSLRVREEGKRR